MSQMWRILIWVMALIVGLAAGATPARAADSGGWVVVFRADEPKLWKHAAGTRSDDNGFSVHVDKLSEKIRYLRLKRMDTGDAVIVPITSVQIQGTGVVDGDLNWNGASRVRRAKGNSDLVLGITRTSWPTKKSDDQMVVRKLAAADSGYRGWGFSTPASGDMSQTYSWAGQAIDKTVFEIAVTANDLSDDEKSHLLDPKESPDTVAEKPETTTLKPSEANAAEETGPTTRLTRKQASIHALYVLTESTQQKLGLATELVLTATPGKPTGKSIPISFTSAAGPEMQAGLGDIARALNAKYPRIPVSKLELSFTDRFQSRDGPSAGAAIGTLMLSLIENFDIDPKLAMTGDVTVDAKVRAIGGVAAKIRAATAGGCTVVGMPVENYDQVVDAMVYEGLPLMENINVIGIGSLDEAAGMARMDRAQKLTDAMKLFGEVQLVLKKTPERLHSREIHDKLSTAVDLWPADYSVKLLLAASQDKQPKRLSARATEYYAMVAVNEVTPTLRDRFKRQDMPKVTSSIVQTSLHQLEKLRRLGDPKIIPLVDACWNFIRECNDVQEGHGSIDNLELRRQQLIDAGAKVDLDRDLTEQMMHQGV